MLLYKGFDSGVLDFEVYISLHVESWWLHDIGTDVKRINRADGD